MKTQNFALATVNDSWAQEGIWSVLFYESGNAGGATATIRVRSLQGNGDVDVELKPGRQIRLAQPARGIVITSLAGTGVVGKISLGNGDIQDSSVMGEVSVVDGGKARTLANFVYSGGHSRAPAAGQFASVQLKNVSADRRIVVSQVTLQTSGADGVALFPGFATAPTAAAFLRSKNLGQADSVVARFYSDSTAVHPSVAAGSPLALFQVNLPASGSFTYKLTEPLILPPGATLAACGSSVSNAIGMSVEEYEELQ